MAKKNTATNGPQAKPPAQTPKSNSERGNPEPSPGQSAFVDETPPTDAILDQPANSGIDEPKPPQRRHEIIQQLFDEGEVERKGSRYFDSDSMAVEAMLGVPLEGDPYAAISDDRLKDLTNEELQRIYLDLVHGPTTVRPKRHAGKLSFDINKDVQFPIAFGPNWRAKWRIAKYLLDLNEPDLAKDGVLVIGPGGTAFHVALQIAWRLRKRIENRLTRGEFFQEVHTDSFEVARLLAPLAVFPEQPLLVYLSGNLVSRHANLARQKLSIITNFRKKPRAGQWIDALVIGCQKIDEKGSLYTWNRAKHKATINSYLEGLGGDLIVVCTSDKIGKSGKSSQMIAIEHPKDKCYLITDQEPSVTPEKFVMLYPSVMP